MQIMDVTWGERLESGGVFSGVLFSLLLCWLLCSAL